MVVCSAVVACSPDLPAEVVKCVEPEGALRLATRRFTARYRRAVELAAADDREPADLEIDDWLAYWKRAKQELKG